MFHVELEVAIFIQQIVRGYERPDAPSGPIDGHLERGPCCPRVAVERGQIRRCPDLTFLPDRICLVDVLDFDQPLLVVFQYDSEIGRPISADRIDAPGIFDLHQLVMTKRHHHGFEHCRGSLARDQNVIGQCLVKLRADRRQKFWAVWGAVTEIFR